MGEALKDEHLGLERLTLDHNEIGGDGGYSIASAMQNKEQLQSLNLNGNQVSHLNRLTIIIQQMEKKWIIALRDQMK